MSLLLQMDSWLAVLPNRCTLQSGQRSVSALRSASSASLQQQNRATDSAHAAAILLTRNALHVWTQDVAVCGDGI